MLLIIIINNLSIDPYFVKYLYFLELSEDFEYDFGQRKQNIAFMNAQFAKNILTITLPIRVIYFIN